jgi:hypothetical protein
MKVKGKNYFCLNYCYYNIAKFLCCTLYTLFITQYDDDDKIKGDGMGRICSTPRRGYKLIQKFFGELKGKTTLGRTEKGERIILKYILKEKT